MLYEIEQWPAFTVCGFKTRLKSDTADHFIPQLWQCAHKDGSLETLTALLHKADLRPTGLLGVCADLNNGRETDYYLAVTTHVDIPNHKALATPQDMACLEVPRALWAIFSADGELSQAMQKTVDTVYRNWPLGRDYLPRPGLPILECYFGSNRQEIWVAVQKTNSISCGKTNGAMLKHATCNSVKTAFSMPAENTTA